MSKINISFIKEILSKISGYKKLVHTSWPGYIFNILENYYYTQVERKYLKANNKDAYEGILIIREMAAPFLNGWDSTSEIRKLRDTSRAGDKK